MYIGFDFSVEVCEKEMTLRNRNYFQLFLLLSAYWALIGCQKQSTHIDTVQVYSEKMNREIPVAIVVPAAVDRLTEKFPVVYLLHGYGGSYRDWISHTDLRPLADRYRVIIVCPDGSTNSWYFDSPFDSTSQYDTFISQELVTWIDAHYHTVSNKQGRAITGLSMGGHGSLYLALRHPQNYIAAGSMSGGVDLTYSTVKWELSRRLGNYEDFPQRWHNNSVINMVEQLKDGELSLVIDCGVDDFFIDINRRLHDKLLQRHISHDYYERPGNHSWDYWVRAIEYHLLFFQEAFHETKHR